MRTDLRIPRALDVKTPRLDDFRVPSFLSFILHLRNRRTELCTQFFCFGLTFVFLKYFSSSLLLLLIFN